MSSHEQPTPEEAQPEDAIQAYLELLEQTTREMVWPRPKSEMIELLISGQSRPNPLRSEETDQTNSS